MSGRSCISLAVLSLALLAGCRDQEPPEAYNVDLGTDNSRLLPMAAGYHAAHNPAINQGNTRATIVKLADFDPAAPVPEVASGGGSMAGVNPQLPPAQGVGNAFGNIGAAFLGNLASGKAAGSASTTTTSAAATGAAPSGAPTGGAPATGEALAAGDKEALYAVVERYGGARKERAFIDLPDLVVSQQRDVALDYYDKLAVLNAMLSNLLTVFEANEPGIKGEFEGQLAKALVAYELTNPARQGPETASATLMPAGGGTPLNVTFRQESGYWRIEDPFVPAAAQWEKVASELDRATEALNAIDEETIAGQRVDANRAREAFSRAVSLLGGGA